jgi:hypothetical protein
MKTARSIITLFSFLSLISAVQGSVPFATGDQAEASFISSNGCVSTEIRIDGEFDVYGSGKARYTKREVELSITTVDDCLGQGYSLYGTSPLTYFHGDLDSATIDGDVEVEVFFGAGFRTRGVVHVELKWTGFGKLTRTDSQLGWGIMSVWDRSARVSGTINGVRFMDRSAKLSKWTIAPESPPPLHATHKPHVD